MEAVTLFIVLLVVTILIGHVLHIYKVQWLTEGSVALLVGLTAGAGTMLYYVYFLGQKIPKALVSFHTEIFLEVMLPPVIFSAGFSVKKKLFFQNFLTLVLFGVVGTWLTAACISVGSYYTLTAVDIGGAYRFAASAALGAIFSSSDSVATLQMLDQEATPMLYSLVFGEGVTNDATSIVLLRAIQNLSASTFSAATMWEVVSNFSGLFVFSLMLGVGVGLLSALIIKHAFVRHSTDREVCVVALMGFLAFLAAEHLQLSGIFAVFFCGITMSHFTWHSLSPSAKVVTVYLFRMMSFLSELFLFIYAGFGMWSSSLWMESVMFSKRQVMERAGALALSLLLCVFAARGLVLLLLVLLANTWRPSLQRIDFRGATLIWWAGSARGAITVALAYQQFGNGGRWVDEHSQIVVVASMAVVAVSTVVLGAVTGPFLKVLVGDGEGAGLATQPSACAGMELEGSLQQPLLGGGATLMQRLGHWNRCSPIHHYWTKLDRGFLQPVFGGRKARPEGDKSPPPSPGRQTMYDVIGPHVLRRLGGAGGSGAATEGAGATAGSVSGGGSEGVLPPGRAAPAAGEGRLSRKDSLQPGFCARDSARLSDAEEEELQWLDEEKFGEEAAYLAAGCPDTPLLPSHSPGGQQGSPGVPRRGAALLPPWPTPFDRTQDAP